MRGMSTRSPAAKRWQKIIREQRASGLSVVGYCRQARVSAWSFYSWRRRLRVERKAAPKFVEVQVARPSTIASAERPSVDPSGVELHLPGGRCVVLRPGFDRRTLLELLHALETRVMPGEVEEAGA
jgi:hypothetical protein